MNTRLPLVAEILQKHSALFKVIQIIRRNFQNTSPGRITGKVGEVKTFKAGLQSFFNLERLKQVLAGDQFSEGACKRDGFRNGKQYARGVKFFVRLNYIFEQK